MKYVCAWLVFFVAIFHGVTYATLQEATPLPIRGVLFNFTFWPDESNKSTLLIAKIDANTINTAQSILCMGKMDGVEYSARMVRKRSLDDFQVILKQATMPRREMTTQFATDLPFPSSAQIIRVASVWNVNHKDKTDLHITLMVFAEEKEFEKIYADQLTRFNKSITLMACNQVPLSKP